MHVIYVYVFAIFLSNYLVGCTIFETNMEKYCTLKK